MGEQAREAIIELANMVYQTQACVLEMVISENGVIAHLIPREVWEEEGGDFD